MPEMLSGQVAIVRARIDALRASFPELEDDADLLAGMVEGETEFDAIMNRIAELYAEKQAVVAGIKSYEETAKKRRERHERSMYGLKMLAYSLMTTAGRKSHSTALATMSVREGMDSVKIDDESALPQGFTRTKTEPAKDEIKKALQAGEDVPGAHLERGRPSLTIRTT